MNQFDMQSGSNNRQRALRKWLNKYAETHTHPTNKLFHYVCVPPIFFTVLALLNALQLFSIGERFIFTAAHVLIVVALIFYAKLSLRYSFIMALVSLAIVSLSSWAQNVWGSNYLFLCVVVFAIAWIGQFIGHKIERAKPAFFDDITFLLVGPLWILDNKLKWSAQ